MRTFVVGYDGSDGAKRALARAVELARALAAKLVVVSVAELPRPLPPYSMGPAGGLAAPALAEPPLPEITPEEAVGDLLAEARERLAGVDAEFEARDGSPDAALIAVADERNAELIVVGTREPGFLSRLLEGSVSEDLARRARCDVLVVHPEHDGD